MEKNLTNQELTEKLRADYGSRTTNKNALEKRKHNIKSFNDINRDGLEYNKREKRILLYETIINEKIFIQFPGKEASENPAKPLDFRPKIQLENGEFALDLSFGAIWDILDEIGKNHNAYLNYVATIFFRLGYMYDYSYVSDKFRCFEVELDGGKETNQSEVEEEQLAWYCLDLPQDVWYTLNDKIGLIELENGQKISLEGFFKLVDLLFQNEDCKYYYKNVVINKKDNYKYDNGRHNSSAANLLILNYLEGNVKISELLDAFQKSRGVPAFKKRDYSKVTGGIVINTDIEQRE